MHAAGRLIVVALVVYLVVIAPLRGRHRYERLRNRLAADAGARLRLYQRTPIRAGLLCALVAVVGVLLDRGLDDVDVRWPDAGWGTGMVLGFLAAFAIGTVVGVRQLRSPRGRAFVEAQLGGARLLLPTTSQERWWSIAVALSAGVWEELVYRGFLAEVVRTLRPQWGWLAVALVTGSVFGLAHLYQGAKGVALTGLLGVALSSIVASTHSLLPALLVHAMIDVRSLTVIGWELNRTGPQPSAVPGAVGGA